MLALIDTDLVAFRCAASVPDLEAEDIAILRCDKLMRDLLDATESDTYRSFLTGPGNFRKQINPDYKANRKDKEVPVHLQSCRNFLIEEWNSEICEGYEADDALGMYQTENSIICTIDKDLDMIPGKHYNWVKGIVYEISEIEAIKFFYKQLLIGDKSDNIAGVYQIGKVKASKIIDSLETEEKMLEAVRSLYDDDQRLIINAQCLWIWRTNNNIWQPKGSLLENLSLQERVHQ